MTEIDRIKNYLKEIGVFTGSPVLEHTREELVCVDPRGHWDEYYMTYPYWQNIPVDFHKTQFDRITSTLRSTDFDEIQKEALREIPNSKNSTIIELGSSYGTFGAGYLAKHKPNARIILIDKLIDDVNEPCFLFNQDLKKYRKLEHILIFGEGDHLINMQRSKERVKKIYEVNGIDNVEFQEIELLPENITEFFSNINLKGDIYLIGHKNPGRLGYTMALSYNCLNARAMWVSLTSQEKIRPSAFPWTIIQKNLDLTDSELNGYIESVFDEKTVDSYDLSNKYDYSNSSHKRVAIMLKLGMACALAKEVNGEVLKNLKENTNYNQTDHYVIAKRN